jgi:hypothetical protein
MIDPETIEEVDDCDGESVHAYGLDAATGQWGWAWVSFEHLAEAGREDIISSVLS